MIRVLILEDDANRISSFRDCFQELGKPHCIEVTKSVNEALGWVQEHPYDLIFLDHDLSDEHYAGEPGNTTFVNPTGYDFAKWFETNPERAHDHGNFFTHSMNPIGRVNIRLAIQSTGKYCPEVPLLWTPKVFSKIFS